MSPFLGGSAFTMARDVGEGYVLVTERTFRGMAEGELAQLAHEVERYMRELRGESGVQEDSTELQARQRRLQRLRQAMSVLRAYQQKKR
jgi:hypothetical protein